MCMSTASILAVGAIAATVTGAVVHSHGQTTAANTVANANTTSAAEQLKASEDATAAQLKASEDALAYEKQTQANHLAAISPYANLGASALGQLGQGLGLPTPGAASGPAAPPNPTAQVPLTAAQSLTTQAPTAASSGLMAQAPTVSQTTQAAAAVPTGASSLGSFGGGIVLMRSPDGKSTQAVPADQVPFWLSKGATQVGASNVVV